MVQQAEADAWVFRTREVLEGGGSDAAQLRHGRQARKRMATDARDSRHISEAGGLASKNPPPACKEKEASCVAAGGGSKRSTRESNAERAGTGSAPEHAPLAADAVPGLLARTGYKEPDLPSHQV